MLKFKGKLGIIYIQKWKIDGIADAGDGTQLWTEGGSLYVEGSVEENKAIYDGKTITRELFSEKTDGLLFRKF